MVKIPVTKFNESKALRISTKFRPKAIEADRKTFFKKIFSVKIIAQNKVVKKKNSC